MVKPGDLSKRRRFKIRLRICLEFIYHRDTEDTEKDRFKRVLLLTCQVLDKPGAAVARYR